MARRTRCFWQLQAWGGGWLGLAPVWLMSCQGLSLAQGASLLEQAPARCCQQLRGS